MNVMNTASDVISISSENSFKEELQRSSPSLFKTSSENETQWTTDDDIDGYDSETNMSGVELISQTGTTVSRKRKLSGDEGEYKIMKATGKKIMKSYKKLKSSF